MDSLSTLNTLVNQAIALYEWAGDVTCGPMRGSEYSQRVNDLCPAIYKRMRRRIEHLYLVSISQFNENLREWRAAHE